MGLGDLKSQLLKAGLVSKKQIHKAKQDERTVKKTKSRQQLEQEKAERKAKRDTEAAARRAADREREAARRTQLDDKEEGLRVRQLADSGSLRAPRGAKRRWYFVARDGTLPFVRVDDQLAGRLERGTAAIVESPDGVSWVVDGDAATRIHQADRDWVRCWQRSARN